MSTNRMGLNPSTGRFQELQKSMGNYLPDCRGAAILLEAVKLLNNLHSEMSIGQLVLAIAKQTSLPQISPVVTGAIQNCDDQVREHAFNWIDLMNASVGTADFWRRPADDLLGLTGLHAVELWKTAAYSENTERFAQFQALLYWFVVFNLVMATLSDPGRNTFVRRAVGGGFFGRIFG